MILYHVHAGPGIHVPSPLAAVLNDFRSIERQSVKDLSIRCYVPSNSTIKCVPTIRQSSAGHRQYTFFQTSLNMQGTYD